MNIGIRQTGLVWLWILMAYGMGYSQVVFNPKIGLETWSLKDESEMSGQSKHPGQMFGVDLILQKEKWSFIPGFEYHRISMTNENNAFNFDFSDPHHAHYFIIPLQAGYHLLGDSIHHISLVGGADINFFYDLDENDLGLEDEMFYGVTTTLTGSVFATFFTNFTVEVKYHYALQAMLKERDDSKLRGWTIAMGGRF